MLDLKDVWTEYRETGRSELRERIIIDCLPLVKYVVGKVAASASPRCEREELLQCGIFGLIDAIERYDPGKEVKFETYAILRIRGAVLDELRSRDWVPRGKRRMARDVDAVTVHIESHDGAIPTADDLASALGVTPAEVPDIIRETSFVSFVSLEDSHGTNGERSRGRDARVADTIEDSGAAQPDSRLELQERARALAEAITELPEQERQIVTRHYYEGARLKDIAALYGVTESRISQVHGRALLLLKMKMQQISEQ